LQGWRKPLDIRRMSVEIVGGPPQAFARYINSELTRWGEVVRAANIKIE